MDKEINIPRRVLDICSNTVDRIMPIIDMVKPMKQIIFIGIRMILPIVFIWRTPFLHFVLLLGLVYY